MTAYRFLRLPKFATASILLSSSLILFAMAFPGGVFAQGNETSAPPVDEPFRPMKRLAYYGIMAGANLGLSSGSFTTTCKCSYEGGSGVMPTAGFYYELPFTPEFQIVGALDFNALGLSYTQNETREEFYESETTVGSYPVEFERTTDVSTFYADLRVYGKWQTGFGGLYIAAGPALGFLVYDHIEETEKALTPGFVYRPDRTPTREYLNSSLDKVYSDVNAIRFAVHGAIGYEWPLSPSFMLAPEVQYSFPLTQIVSGNSEWKHAAIQFGVRAKFAM